MEKVTKSFKVLIATGGFLFMVLMAFFLVNTEKAKKMEAVFVNSGITGILIGLEDLSRGSYTLTIKEYKTNKIYEYDLHISKFVRENSIKINDSISKEPMSNSTFFYKKDDRGVYKLFCELKYY